MVTNEKHLEKILAFRSKKEVEDYVGKDICDFYVNASDKDVAAKDKDILNSLESDQCDLDSANETINSSEALIHSLNEKLRVAAITRDEKLAECDKVIYSTEKKIVELQQLLNEAKQVLEHEKGTQEKAISAYTATERQVKDEERSLQTQVDMERVKDISDFYVNVPDKDVAAKDKDVLNSLESDQCDLDSANETINSSEALFHSLNEKLRVAVITRDEKLAECDKVIDSTEKKIVELQQLMNEVKQVLEHEMGTKEKAIAAYSATECQVNDEERSLQSQFNHAKDVRCTLKVDMERKLIESAFIDYIRTDNVDKVYTYMSSDEVFEEEGLSDQRIRAMTQDPDIVRQKRRLRRWGYHRNRTFIKTFGQYAFIPLSTRHGKIDNVKVNGEQNYIAICFHRPLPNPCDDQVQPPETVANLYALYRVAQSIPPISTWSPNHPQSLRSQSPLRPLGCNLPRLHLSSSSPAASGVFPFPPISPMSSFGMVQGGAFPGLSRALPLRPSSLLSRSSAMHSFGKDQGGASPVLSRAPMHPFGNEQGGVSALRMLPIPSTSANGSAFSSGTQGAIGLTENYSNSGGGNKAVKNQGSPEAIKKWRKQNLKKLP